MGFNVDAEEKGGWWWLEIVLDFVFVGDIFLNFRTGYFVEDEMVMDPWMVAKNYIRTWFILDVVSSVPFNLLTVAAADTSYAKLLKSGKFIKVREENRTYSSAQALPTPKKIARANASRGTIYINLAVPHPKITTTIIVVVVIVVVVIVVVVLSSCCCRSSPKVFKMLRITKIIRFIKGSQFAEHLDDWINMSASRHTLRITKLLIGTIFASHINCCIWAGVGNANGDGVS